MAYKRSFSGKGMMVQIHLYNEISHAIGLPYLVYVFQTDPAPSQSGLMEQSTVVNKLSVGLVSKMGGLQKGGNGLFSFVQITMQLGVNRLTSK